MPSERTQAIRQNLLYAMGIVVMKGVSLFMLPFIAHRLSPADFGRLEILTSLGAVGSILVGLGLVNTLFRFAGGATDRDERRALAAQVHGLTLLLGAAALVAGIALAATLDSWLPGELGQHNIVLAVAMIALEGCIAIPLGWLRMHDRAGLFFALNTGKAMLQAALVVVFLEQGRGVEGVMTAGLVSALLLAGALLFIQYRDTGITLRLSRTRELLRYSVPLVGSGLLGFVLTGLDRWILADAVGTAEMAQYAIAAKFAMVAALLLQPFLMWWSPRRFEVLNETDGTRKAARFAAFGSALSLFVMVTIGLSAPLLIELLLPPLYWDSIRYVPWLVLTVAVKDSAELLNLGCYTGRSTRAQFYINLAGSGVGLVGMLWMTPLWGIPGAIAALLLAQLTRLVLYVAVSQRLLPLPYPASRLAGMAVLGVVLLALGGAFEGLPAQALMALIGMATMLAAAAKLGLAPVLRTQGAN